MQSTYKLLSIYLDGKPLPEAIPAIRELDVINYEDISKPNSLLDYPVCIRKASALFLLSFVCFADIQNMLYHLNSELELTIVLDYQSLSPEANCLFMKRILQLVEMIKRNNPTVTIILGSKVTELNHYLSQIITVA